MTTDREDLLEQLDNLRRLSKKKKYQLAKPEQDEVLSVLSALATADQEGYRAVVASLPEFPSDVGAELLANCWTELTEAEAPIPRDLREQEFSTDLGKRMRLALAQRLLVPDPDSAIRVLVDVCREMKPTKKAMPTLKHLGLIRTAFVEPAANSVGRLPLEKAMASEVALLTAYLLAAAFIPRKKSQKPVPPQTQLAMIRWVNTYPNLMDLSTDVTTAIAQTVTTWDEDFRGLLAAEINTLQAALRKVLQPLCQPTRSSGPLKDAQPSPKSSPSEPATPPAQARQYDAQYELGRLSKYVRQLEERLKKSKKAGQRAERNWQNAQKELAATRREQQGAMRRASVAKESATRLAREKSELEQQIDVLQSALQTTQTRLEAAGIHHEQTIASHDEQLDSLSERIAREGEHRVSAFRNRLAARVQTYADGLKEADEMEMTQELGTALFNQMKQLVRFLKAEGVRIDGDK